MSLHGIVKRASSFLGLKTADGEKSYCENGDIVYCKNNVCVHTPSKYRGERGLLHHPGYMVVRRIENTDVGSSLSLTWIPNEKLKRNYDTVSQISAEDENHRHSFDVDAISFSSLLVNDYEVLDCRKSVEAAGSSQTESDSAYESHSSKEITSCSVEGDVQSGSAKLNDSISGVDDTSGCINSSDSSPFLSEEGCTVSESNDNDKQKISSDTNFIEDKCEATERNQLINLSETEAIPLPQQSLSTLNDCYSAGNSWYDKSAESLAYSVNLAFPDISVASSRCVTPVDGGSSPVRREHKCGIFQVDLSEMKSLRLFFSDKEKSCGQLVIASQEYQYKILHFHYGGLDKLASVFEDWNLLIKQKEDDKMDCFKQFKICRPQINDCELHPDELKYGALDAENWLNFFSEDGVIEDDLLLRRWIFFGGVESSLRVNVWPFLLHYYDFLTTFAERQYILEEKHLMYKKLNERRESMSNEEQKVFWRTVQCTVEKDVVRTDRCNPTFSGQDNPNLEKMKRILLNFAVYNPEKGYTQGMSDILAPILSEVRNEVDVFWCFTGLMSKTIFVTSPTDKDMELNLDFFTRCFKREFHENEMLAMWEACWSNYQTDYFHLFLVVAIVSIYGSDVVEQNLRADETLLYFTSLAMHMDGYLVLKKARGLLHNFRSRGQIPCTLVGLCEYCGPGMWDSGHEPTVTCSEHHEEFCPVLAQK